MSYRSSITDSSSTESPIQWNPNTNEYYPLNGYELFKSVIPLGSNSTPCMEPFRFKRFSDGLRPGHRSCRSDGHLVSLLPILFPTQMVEGGVVASCVLPIALTSHLRGGGITASDLRVGKR